MLAGAPPTDLPYHAEGMVAGLTAGEFHERATQSVRAAGFNVGDFPGGPFLRGVIIKSKREIYGHVLGERGLSEAPQPKYAGLIPAAALVGGLVGIAAAGVGFYYVPVTAGLLRAMLGVGGVTFCILVAYGIVFLQRPSRYEGEMLVVVYTAPPPSGTDQRWDQSPTVFRVVVSAGRELTSNISGRRLAGRVAVHSLPGGADLEPYPQRVLSDLNAERPLSSSESV